MWLQSLKSVNKDFPYKTHTYIKRLYVSTGNIKKCKIWLSSVSFWIFFNYYIHHWILNSCFRHQRKLQFFVLYIWHKVLPPPINDSLESFTPPNTSSWQNFQVQESNKILKISWNFAKTETWMTFSREWYNENPKVI